jgi:arsenate reductase
MPKKNLLFLCVANSARSQMAEALARRIYKDEANIQSAGSEPSRVNPYAIEAIESIGLTMEQHHAKSVTEIDPATVDIVITLCAEEVCPAFLGEAKRYHWPLSDPDPKDLILEDDAVLRRFERARDLIQERLVTEKEVLFAN